MRPQQLETKLILESWIRSQMSGRNRPIQRVMLCLLSDMSVKERVGESRRFKASVIIHGHVDEMPRMLPL